jgi:Cu/Ag efflux protein CusF
MIKIIKRIFTGVALPSALAILIALPVAANAADPITHQKDTVTVKAKIEAIDHDTRMITLKDKDGSSRSIYAGPEVRRFEELKVGDEVTFRTTESVVYQIRKPGEPAPPSSKDAPVIVRNAGAKPGGTRTEQETKTVTVKSVDTKASAVTIQTEEGRTMSMKVDDKKLLKGLNAGDRVVITYTTAVAISVE